jgi:hypothetical protein
MNHVPRFQTALLLAAACTLVQAENNLRGPATAFDGKTTSLTSRVQVSSHGVEPTR